MLYLNNLQISLIIVFSDFPLIYEWSQLSCPLSEMVCFHIEVIHQTHNALED